MMLSGYYQCPHTEGWKGCQSAAEPRYRALAGKKGVIKCQCRGDVVAVLPRLELVAVDVVFAHASAKLYAAQAARTAGWTAARAEQTKRRMWFRKDVPDHAAFRFVPFAVETCKYMGKEAVKFVNRLRDIATESGSIPKGAFVRWAMQLLSVTVQRGKSEMYRQSGPIGVLHPWTYSRAGIHTHAQVVYLFLYARLHKHTVHTRAVCDSVLHSQLHAVPLW